MASLLFLIVMHLPSCFGMDIPTMEITSGVHIPVLSIGCGGLEHGKAKVIVSNWLSLGGRGIDTALNYNNQDEVKAAIDEYNITREEVFLTTKIPGCNVHTLVSDVQKDLELLGTSYLDLLLIHAPRGGDCALAWNEMEKIYAANQTRAIGVSNFHRKDLEEILESGATIVPHVNQIRTNVLLNDPETICFTTKHGITIEAYSPLGRANHSGDITGNAVIQEIAKGHKVTTYQIALRWILQHGWILAFQSSSKEHQAIDADIFGFKLTHQEMKKLDGLSGITVASDLVFSNAVFRGNVAAILLTLSLMIIIWLGRRKKVNQHALITNILLSGK